MTPNPQHLARRLHPPHADKHTLVEHTHHRRTTTTTTRLIIAHHPYKPYRKIRGGHGRLR